MKIIKRGSKQHVGNTIHRMICNNCGTEFEFYQKEAQIFWNGENDFDYMLIHCPDCKNANYKNI